MILPKIEFKLELRIWTEEVIYPNYKTYGTEIYT